MKKIFLFILMSTFSISFSQGLENKKGENILPSDGEWSISSSATPIFNFLNKVFTSSDEQSEFLFSEGLHIDVKKMTSVNSAIRYNFGLNYDSQVESWSFGLGYGVENRRGDTRLQGLWGYQGLVAIGDHQEYNMNISVSAFVGCEYFMLAKMSIGAEYHYGGTIDVENDETTFRLGGNTTQVKINYYF